MLEQVVVIEIWTVGCAECEVPSYRKKKTYTRGSGEVYGQDESGGTQMEGQS